MIHYNKLIITFMPTTKRRLNITLSDEMDRILAFLAKRDQVPQATKAIYLIKQAIELDEDDVFNKLAAERDRKDAKFIDHKDAWK